MNSLQFRVLGFPVEVLPNAFLLAGIFFLFGLSWGWGIPWILGIIAVAVVSVLFHELGHALTARGLGLEPVTITLHGMGGLTRHPAAGSPGRELAIILAGPGFGLLLAGLAFVLYTLSLPGVAGELAWYLLFLNVLWSVFNLIPVFPLDGGQALSAFLQLFIAPATAWPITWGVGLVGAVALAIGALAWGEIFILFFAGMFAWRNAQMLRSWRARDRD